MDWKETVIKTPSHIWNGVSCPYRCEAINIEDDIIAAREEQAEITWVKAFQAGEQKGRAAMEAEIRGTTCKPREAGRLQVLTDEGIRQVILSDKKRVSGWTVTIMPRDKAVAQAQRDYDQRQIEEADK